MSEKKISSGVFFIFSIMHRLWVHASIRVVTFKAFDLETLAFGISTSVAGFPAALGGVKGIES